MRFFGLAGLLIVIFLGSACAIKRLPVVLDNLQYRPSRTYEFVSVDLSICGKEGTLPVDGTVNFGEDGIISFDFIDPILGQERVVSRGPFKITDDSIVFTAFDTELNGNFRAEKRTDGIYLIITFKSSSDELHGFDWVFKRK